ncbi:MAG: DNA topoisomerase IB [Candidatus Eisenbacteria bacterium]
MNGAESSNGTAESAEHARSAGLHYVSDAVHGIRRVRAGKGFRYVTSRGRRVRDPVVLARIRALAIPPAWTEVWICASPRGHIQAMGRDARRRKQYRYHSRWREVRDATKYGQLVAFGEVLPALRRRVERDLRRPALPREKVLATVARLLETTLIRVGNEEYARTNRSFGLTTLRDRHVEIAGHTLEFQFRGKSGKQHLVRLTDRRLARIVKACQDIPGQELFQYVDDAGEAQTIDSADVNGYLREIAGTDCTAKLFRTWAGTMQAITALGGLAPTRSVPTIRQNLVEVVKVVAAKLGNTPAICRRCYIHPAVIDSYLGGAFRRSLQALRRGRASRPAGLSASERLTLAFLRNAHRRQSL